MDITLSYEEIVEEQRQVISNLQHELLLKNLTIRKMDEKIAENLQSQFRTLDTPERVESSKEL